MEEYFIIAEVLVIKKIKANDKEDAANRFRHWANSLDVVDVNIRGVTKRYKD